ncbi:MAG: helix-turn-helix transcriptional regulator [Pseudomonadota bacterium]
MDGAPAPEEAPPTANQTVEGLQAQIAARVREARRRIGVPRRVLSEMSGVSQRYLAQLEAGEGNISVGLLLRVAQALDVKIEHLIGEDDPWESEVLRAAELYRAADRTARDAALAALAADQGDDLRAGRICLIGLRGAGKSTLGALAAKTLNIPFLELNDEIEALGGMPVGEIMALYGDEGYRKLEAEALESVASSHGRVLLAAAGGVVAEPRTFSVLLSRFNTVWVTASPDEHMNRVRAQGDERPMAGNPRAMDQLKQILAGREALYAQAQARLDTSGAALDASLAELLSIIEENGCLT